MKNVIIFGVENRSSFHTDNHQNNSLALGEGPTYTIVLMKVLVKQRQ